MFVYTCMIVFCLLANAIILTKNDSATALPLAIGKIIYFLSKGFLSSSPAWRDVGKVRHQQHQHGPACDFFLQNKRIFSIYDLSENDFLTLQFKLV